ncbi:MAG: ferritin-like domain-containing protein [Solirubrobacterales bacterium]
MSGEPQIRREALRRGLLTGGAAISAAIVPALLRAGPAFAQEATSEGDPGIVEGAIGLEQTAVLVYGIAVSSKLLGPATPVAELFRKQEQAHADVLIATLKDLGGSVPAPPRPADVAGLSEVKTDKDFLDFALELENLAVATYADALMNLQDPALMKQMAPIMANEGQHLVVLRQALGSNPVPTAFPTGNEKG